MGDMYSSFYHYQTCIAANRILVQDGIINEYVDKLSKKVAELRLGPGFTEGVNQGPLINQPAIDKAIIPVYRIAGIYCEKKYLRI